MTWPGGARAAVSVTVDNLGEAAELQLGLREADAPLGGHYSVTTALPIMLGALAAARQPATFFVEGINAEIYPDALRAIRDAGHELAYHAWCHEEWAALDPAAEAANLDRGLAALRAIGLEPAGFRPPGGRLTPRTLELLAARGLRHCSPAGSAPGVERGVVLLPFAWPAVDAFHVLPAFAALRARLTGDAEPGGPEAVRAALLQRVEDALAQGGHAVLVLHTWLIEAELDVVRDVLARVRAGAERGELWAAPCSEVAAWIAEHAGGFGAAPRLDDTSWAAPA
ncbi:MAG TPA: polysaccharide deacetylase family protein [Conexibacter sp.]|nr:polysaccharide deacetylase family protein [Conexibacter sp.]